MEGFRSDHRHLAMNNVYIQMALVLLTVMSDMLLHIFKDNTKIIKFHSAIRIKLHY